jgi:hypothetical protein
VLGHLERNLGRYEFIWSEKSSNHRVVLFRDRPAVGALTYSTVGLAAHQFVFREDQVARQELLFSCLSGFAAASPESLLFSCASIALSAHRAFDRGEMIRDRGPVLPGYDFSALYFALPVYFSEELFALESTEPPTLFLWVVPLHRREEEFVAHHGWEMFEEALESQDPNLLDLARPAFL